MRSTFTHTEAHQSDSSLLPYWPDSIQRIHQWQVKRRYPIILLMEGLAGYPSREASSIPSPIPDMTPIMPPIRQMIIASTMNCSRIELFSAPRAFLVPISLILSVMDTSMIFITPIPPTSSAMPAITEIAMVMVDIYLFITIKEQTISPENINHLNKFQGMPKGRTITGINNYTGFPCRIPGEILPANSSFTDYITGTGSGK